MKFLSWLVVNTLALGVAVWLFDGISLTGGSDTEKLLRLLGVGLVFGVVTAIVRPVVKFVSLPIIVLTLGLMLLVINALMLMLTSAISGAFDLGFDVDGFWTALWGSIVISISLIVLEAVMPGAPSRMTGTPSRITGGNLPAPSGTPYRIGFVCLGNICRSPMADVVLTELVDVGGLTPKVAVSSCGTGDWHIGHPMDPRAATALLAEGYDPSLHRAQQFEPSWLEQDLLLVMDSKNLHDVTGGAGTSERVRMFRSFDPLVPEGADPSELDVPDPYYGGEDGFAEVVAIVERTCRRLLSELEAMDL